MSTRGAVAWGNLDSWTGLYNHYDSYPSGLGQDVWDHVKKLGAQEFISRVSAHSSWVNYLREGLCPYCGKSASPTTISGSLFAFDDNLRIRKNGIDSLGPWEKDNFLVHSDPERWVAYQKKARGEFWDKDRWIEGPDGEGKTLRLNMGYRDETVAGLLIAYAYKNTGFPDPDVMFHSHREETDDAVLMNQDTSDKLFMEWVYIVDAEANMIHVLCNGRTGVVKPGLRQVGPAQDCMDCTYAHWLVASVPLSKKAWPKKIASAYPEEEE